MCARSNKDKIIAEYGTHSICGGNLNEKCPVHKYPLDMQTDYNRQRLADI
jgi:hypothetical protein